jgi:hypothetical protein
VRSRNSPAWRSSPAAPLWRFRTQASKPTKHTSPPSSSEHRLRIPRRLRSPEARRRPSTVPTHQNPRRNPRSVVSSSPSSNPAVRFRSVAPEHIT